MRRLDLDQSDKSALYLRIAETLRGRILEGEFGAEGRLPTHRELSRRLGVNRNTVVSAYRKLGEWGLIRPRVGRGTFAAPAPSMTRAAGAHEPAGREDPLPAGSSVPWSGIFSRALEGRASLGLSTIYSVGTAEGTISFAGSFPATDLLPSAAFRGALERALRRDARRALAYGPAQGLPALRAWIASDMTRRGMPTSVDEVLITNGSQQAIDLIARAFTNPEDPVLIENPTYSGAISTFQSFGARLIGLPLDAEGVLPESIGAAAGRGGAKLLYLTPTFQNPTSAVLSADRRRRVLEAASATNLLVVEDDWAAGLRFEGSDLPTLRSLDGEGRVIYISTFAKKLIPGLRIGWVAAARPIIERLVVLKQINDCCTSPLIQSALVEYCASGALERHLPKVRAAYRERRNRMLEALKRHFPSRAGWTRPEGGMFLWVRLPEGIDPDALFAEAAARGVLVSRGELFHVDGGGQGFLRLTFASSLPGQIDDGIRILGSVMKKQVSHRARPGAGEAREAIPLV